MRSVRTVALLTLTFVSNFVTTMMPHKNNQILSLISCKQGALSLRSELECIYQNYGTPLNLSGVTVRATAPEGNLTQGEIVFETVRQPTGENRLRFKEGFGVEVLHGLQHALEFNVKVITAKGWATQYPNKSWFGMARQIIDDVADLSLAKTSILPNRAQDLGYLVPTHGLGLYAFFVQPSSKTGRNIFLEPFSTSLWICLLVIYLILIASIKIICKLGKKMIGPLSPEDHTLTEAVAIWSCHTICQHGFHSPPKLSCLRIAILTGVVLGLILYVSYSAQLVSIFSITTPPIKNIEDLLKSQINIVVDENNQRARNMIETPQGTNNGSAANPDPTSRRLQAHIKSQQLKKTLASAGEGGGAILKNGDPTSGGAPVSFITFKDTFFTTIKNTFKTGDDELCLKISTVPVTGGTFKSGLFVKKGSHFKEPFNVKMITMYNSGLMARFVIKYEDTYTPRCNRDGDTLAPVITIPDVIFVFYGLLLGFLGCLVICGLEFFIAKSRIVNFLLVVCGAMMS